jgi:hypothetical protein
MQSQLQAFRGDSRIEASESISVAVSQKLGDGEDAVRTTSGFCLKAGSLLAGVYLAERIWRRRSHFGFGIEPSTALDNQINQSLRRN